MEEIRNILPEGGKNGRNAMLAAPPPAPPAVRALRLAILAGVLLLFFVVVPVLNQQQAFPGLRVPDYKVNVLGKYLCYAIVALGINLIWGQTGLLSLCQAMFFCLGGYAMAMHLSLPDGGGVYEVPQFLTYVYYGHADPIPPFWKPFHSLGWSLLAVVAVPAVVAAVFGFFIFRSRVRGVYFSIVTQAVAWGSWLLISRHEMLLGGTNGLTNFNKAFTGERRWILGLYLTTAATVVLAYLVCRWLYRSRLGRVLVAVRDREPRLYFAGYQPYAFKIFAFAVGAALAGVGGALYSPQVGIITPQNMNVRASIDLVIMVALGGRGKLWGGIFGALLFNYSYAALTSDMPAVWPFLQGAIFIAAVLLFPDGFVGLWDKVEHALATRQEVAAAVLSGATVVLLALFVLGEALGLTPAALQSDVAFGPTALRLLAWVAVGGALARLVHQTRAAPFGLQVLARVGGGLVAVGLCVGAYFLADTTVAMKWKYVVLVGALAGLAVAHYVTRYLRSRPTTSAAAPADIKAVAAAQGGAH